MSVDTNTTLAEDGRAVVLLTILSSVGDKRTLEELCREISRLLGTQQPVYLRVDTTALRSITCSALHKELLGFLRLNRERIAKYIIKSEIIVRSDLVRMFLRGMFKVYTPASPMTIVRG